MTINDSRELLSVFTEFGHFKELGCVIVRHDKSTETETGSINARGLIGTIVALYDDAAEVELPFGVTLPFKFSQLEPVEIVSLKDTRKQDLMSARLQVFDDGIYLVVEFSSGIKEKVKVPSSAKVSELFEVISSITFDLVEELRQIENNKNKEENDA